jgi:Na+/H+ antiporter NhaC
MKTKYVTPGYLREFFRLGNSKRDNALLKYIISRLEYKKYGHESYVCRAGDEAGAMYFIESGTIVVRGENGEIINELQPGRYFGEYAALSNDKRMADIQAKGTVQLFALGKNTLLNVVRYQPGIYGLFLKKAYEQATEKYRSLVRILNARRGIGSGSPKKKQSRLSLFFNYFAVFLVFLAALLFAPGFGGGEQQIGSLAIFGLDVFAAKVPLPVWFCSPIVFMTFYMIITKRPFESLVLSVMFVAILLSKLGFVGVFCGQVLDTVAGAPDLIVMVLLMGSLTKLFSASGSINALKSVAGRKIGSAGGILTTSFFSMIFIALDEYLSILINGACFVPLADEKRVPREKSAMVMGMTPGALCILNPISLTGIYLSGLIAAVSGRNGLFLQSVRYNYAAMITLVLIFLLALGVPLPGGGLKKAAARVKGGGELWPEGTENPEGDEQGSQGKVVNLLLPVLVLIAASILPGWFLTGSFQVNVLNGLVITLIFTFFLYSFQRYMTADQFFRNIVFGIESMIAPIVMFVLGKCFANGMEDIGFSAWLTEIVRGVIHGQVWLLPVMIFTMCTVMGALFDNPWAMYAIGMPIAAGFAASLNGNPALYLGAVCAAGLIGNEIALGDIFFIGSMLGINPVSYYRAKLPCVLCIAVLTFIAFGAAGWFGI